MPQLVELSDVKRQLLAKYLRGEKCAASSAHAIDRRQSNEPPCLSLAQERLWSRAREHPELTCYNEPITIYRKGPLDPSILERSLMEVLARHESWRTTFTTIGGKPVQIVHAPSRVVVPLDDVSHLPEASREAEALRLATQDARIPFDLERGPLFRPRVVRLAENDLRLFVTVHHLIMDGVTVFDIFFAELATIYDSLAAGKTPFLPHLPVQYADFAQWQRQQLTGDVIAQEEQYWRQQLSDAPPASLLPTDFPRREEQTFRGSISSFALPERLTNDLRSLSRHQGVTPFVTLLAVFLTLLNRYTAQQDIVVGTIVPGGRKRSEVEHVMGLFENRVPLRIRLSGDPTLPELLARVRNVVSEALCHDDVPFEIVADELQPDRDATTNLFYQTIMSLVPPVPDVGQGWSFNTMDFDPGGARVELNLELDDRPSGMRGIVQFNRDLFKQETISRFVHDFRMTLEAFVAGPKLRLSDLAPLKLTQTFPD